MALFRQMLEEEDAERFVIQVFRERQVEVWHKGLFRAQSDFFGWMVVDPERAQSFERVEPVAHLDAVAADGNSDFIRRLDAVEDQGKAGQEDENRQQKIFRQDGDENQNDRADPNGPEPTRALLIMLVFQCFPLKLHPFILTPFSFLRKGWVKVLEPELLVDENNVYLPAHKDWFSLEDEKFGDGTPTHTDVFHMFVLERKNVIAHA